MFWVVEIGNGGVSFCIVGTNFDIRLVGCCHIPIVAELNAEVKALTVGLHHANMEYLRVKKVFVSYPDLLRLSKGRECVNAWRSN